MVKKNGFYLLEPINTEDSIDIGLLEKKYNLQLPPLYRLFAQTYHLGKNKIIREKYLNTEFNDYFDLIAYSFSPKPEIGFSHFNEVTKSFEVWDSKYLPDIIYEKKYFPIAPANFGGICLGLNESYKDKIIYDNGENSSFEVIANDIFDFTRNIEIKLIKQEFLYSNLHHEKLYKNWGEGFWRVKENEE